MCSHFTTVLQRCSTMTVTCQVKVLHAYQHMLQLSVTMPAQLSLTLIYFLLLQLITWLATDYRWTIKCQENSSHVWKPPSEAGDRRTGPEQVLWACYSQQHIINTLTTSHTVCPSQLTNNYCNLLSTSCSLKNNKIASPLQSHYVTLCTNYHCFNSASVAFYHY